MSFIPFLRADVLRRMPTPINEREEMKLELDDFPEFVSDISPEQQKKIDELAVEIVKSQSTRDPFFQFRTEGHADVARTIPASQRQQFEKDISQERADNALKLLMDAINRKGGTLIAARVGRGSRAFGLGTQRLKIPNAMNEAQFRKNRRVQFIVRQVTMVPPGPEPEPAPKSVVEDRFTAQLIQGGNLTVGALHVIESFTLVATIKIVDKIDKKSAEFVVTATGVGLGAGPTKIGGSINFAPGLPVPFKTFRLTGVGGGTVDLNSFVGRVTVFVDAGGGAGPSSTTKGGTLSFSFDALESAGANTQPTVIRLSGGNESLSAPSIAAGDVLPLGRMTMKGTPTSF